jgi:hypothetical protein
MSYLEKVGATAYAMARAGRLEKARSLLKKAESRPNARQAQRGIWLQHSRPLASTRKRLRHSVPPSTIMTSGSRIISRLPLMMRCENIFVVQKLFTTVAAL